MTKKPQKCKNIDGCAGLCESCEQYLSETELQSRSRGN